MARKKTRKKRRTRVKGAVVEVDPSAQYYVTQYEITDEPIEHPAFRRLPESVKKKLESLYQEARRNPRQAIPELLELRKKYPRVPHTYNYLAVAYSYAGEPETAEAITLENIRRNPDYLFARLNQAELCLAKGEYERIPEIFENKYDLKLLYPKRKKFHISEVANFMGIMGLYFSRIGQRDAAENYNEFLQEIASDFPITRMLNRELHPPITRRLLRRLLGGSSKK